MLIEHCYSMISVYLEWKVENRITNIEIKGNIYIVKIISFFFYNHWKSWVEWKEKLNKISLWERFCIWIPVRRSKSVSNNLYTIWYTCQASDSKDEGSSPPTRSICLVPWSNIVFYGVFFIRVMWTKALRGTRSSSHHHQREALK